LRWLLLGDFAQALRKISLSPTCGPEYGNYASDKFIVSLIFRASFSRPNLV
jgi:hypothetical protein